MYQYKYPHLRYDRKEVEQAYQEGLTTFNAMTQEERIKRGFGENGHAHPRRFYIFIHKHFKEIKYFMSSEQRDNYVFPWVVATRSERKAALKKSQSYFDIKQIIMQTAKIKYETYKIKQEINELENEHKRIR